jgi:hypothetical protein
MGSNVTPVVRHRRLGDPVLVPASAVAAALVVVLGLGAVIGWLAGRAPAAAPPAPAPVIVERACPPPEPAPAAPASPTAAAQVGATPIPAPAPPAARVRSPHVRMARVARDDSWEPAPL